MFRDGPLYARWLGQAKLTGSEANRQDHRHLNTKIAHAHVDY